MPKTEGLSCQLNTVNVSIEKCVIYLALLKKILRKCLETWFVLNQEICKSLRASNKFDLRNVVMEQ